MKYLVFALLATYASATEYLTSDNFDDITSGKKVFVAFKAP